MALSPAPNKYLVNRDSFHQFLFSSPYSGYESEVNQWVKWWQLNLSAACYRCPLKHDSDCLLYCSCKETRRILSRIVTNANACIKCLGDVVILKDLSKRSAKYLIISLTGECYYEYILSFEWNQKFVSIFIWIQLILYSVIYFWKYFLCKEYYREIHLLSN